MSSAWRSTKHEHGHEEQLSFLDKDASGSNFVRASALGPSSTEALRQRTSDTPWIVSTGVLATALLTTIFLKLQQPISAFHIGHAFLSDMPDARRAIQYEQQRYTGSLAYDLDSKIVFRAEDSEIDYFGRPSPEIDGQWEKLLSNEFPVLWDDEMTPDMAEKDRLPNDHHFHFEPDVFHNLHCLNVIRKRVARSLYPDVKETPEEIRNHEIQLKNGGPDWDRVHLEHCMDRIRQALMCHADLTPSPLQWWPGSPLALGKTGERTCRKWAPIRQWMDERWALRNQTQREQARRNAGFLDVSTEESESH